MGKAKNQIGESASASASISRMNYLYQASLLTSKLSGNTSLSCYYGRLMKEISMKMVEKVHPNIKRTMCCACNYTLTGSSHVMNVKIKSHPKKKKKKRKNMNEFSTGQNITKVYKSIKNITYNKGYKRNKIDVKNIRPNTVNYVCKRCTFSKSYLLKPNYDIWINKMNDS